MKLGAALLSTPEDPLLGSEVYAGELPAAKRLHGKLVSTVARRPERAGRRKPAVGEGMESDSEGGGRREGLYRQLWDLSAKMPSCPHRMIDDVIEKEMVGDRAKISLGSRRGKIRAALAETIRYLTKFR